MHQADQQHIEKGPFGDRNFNGWRIFKLFTNPSYFDGFVKTLFSRKAAKKNLFYINKLTL